jgi:hypothetical protein
MVDTLLGIFAANGNRPKTRLNMMVMVSVGKCARINLEDRRGRPLHLEGRVRLDLLKHLPTMDLQLRSVILVMR